MAEEHANTEELEPEEGLEEETEEAEPSIPRPPDEVVGTCPACPSMAPAWMATFADMATLLMAFFVLILSFVDLGNIPYSAVTQPIFFPFRKRGTVFSMVALHITLVLPNSTKTDPSG